MSKIFVTQPFLPPLEEFMPYLERIWQEKWLTNNGTFHRQLETKLADYLGVSQLSLFTNGTIALITALQALRITGEVITTPYTFVATAHSLIWNKNNPVFVDIDPTTFNIDPNKVEAAITPQTSAILAVHVYGTPCDTEKLQQIADVYGLKLIYDAAHAFGVRQNGNTVLNHGDLSILSFHATKVYNTFEGGAIVCNDEKLKQRIDYLKNFGFADEVTVMAPGINGKMNEFQAALGLLQLDYIDQCIAARQTLANRYRRAFKDLPGIRLLPSHTEREENYSYFPILIEEDYPISRNQLYSKLREQDIYARRYFYPLVSDFPMYRGLPSAAENNLQVAKQVSEQILCLPIYPDLSEESQLKIIHNIHKKKDWF
ncbi:DegT/DnrJ/EryC1/StrS family aminotransferase [Methylomonas rivi]|nr:DegT/DnrJ/EryC1/StrS family aminotransferase [Methylomonas sp. WSC-6]